MRELLRSWTDDVRTLAPGADPAAGASVGADLVARWSQPHRRYHTRQHLAEMFGAFDALSGPAGLAERDLAVLRVAAWLHDAVYDVRARPGDTERESAALGRKSLSALGFRQDDVDTVESLVLLTIAHDDAAAGVAGDVFHDADLWILAAPTERFDEYCAQVRTEYAHVPDDAYATGRARILSALTRRTHVYRTGYARRSWSDPARANVRRELDRLR